MLILVTVLHNSKVFLGWGGALFVYLYEHALNEEARGLVICQCSLFGFVWPFSAALWLISSRNLAKWTRPLRSRTRWSHLRGAVWRRPRRRWKIMYQPRRVGVSRDMRDQWTKNLISLTSKFPSRLRLCPYENNSRHGIAEKSGHTPNYAKTPSSSLNGNRRRKHIITSFLLSLFMCSINFW